MTNYTQEVPIGTEFKATYADGYLTFVVTHIADIGDTTVYLAESVDGHNSGYENVQKAFTHADVKAAMRWS
jgi:hypothetical protein